MTNRENNDIIYHQLIFFLRKSPEFTMKNFEAIIQKILQGDQNALHLLSYQQHLTTSEELKFDRLINENINTNSNAVFLRGVQYYRKKEYSLAIDFFDKAIAQGNVFAMSWRGIMYYTGKGGEKDYFAATAIFDQAIALGSATAMFHEANMLLEKNNQADFIICFNLLDAAIKLENVGAITYRGVLHAKGTGEQSPNYPAAIKLFDQGVALGSPESMTNRAIMHNLGQGGSVDHHAAIQLLDKAIEYEHANAMHLRACMHVKGEGGPPDITTAVKLFNSAIALNHERAMLNLATILRDTQRPVTVSKVALHIRRAVHVTTRKRKQDNEVLTRGMRELETIASETKSFDAQYHFLLAQKKLNKLSDLFNTNPDKLCVLLSEDELLTPKQKRDILKSFNTDLIMKLQQIQNPSALNLIGNHFLMEGNELVNMSLSTDFDLYLTHYYEALSYYNLVPRSSTSYGQACYAKAMHLYNRITQRTNNSNVAFISIQSILEDGISVNDIECEEFYCNTIGFILEWSHRPSDMDWKKAKSNFDKSILRIEELASSHIERFIVKYRLDENSYWQKQNNSNVPIEILDLSVLLLNPGITSIKKLDELEEKNISVQRSWSAMFFKIFGTKSEASTCIQEALSLPTVFRKDLDIRRVNSFVDKNESTLMESENVTFSMEAIYH